jgi:hypothetical protein
MSCGNIDKPATQIMPADLIDALLCLINEVRAKHGVQSLYLNDRLRNAALEHATQAVGLRWWGGNRPAWHVNPITGSTPESRIRASGFAQRAVLSAFGEVCHGAATKVPKEELSLSPRHAFDTWMGEPEDRAQLLNAAFRSTGIAILPQSPFASSGKDQDFNPKYATYVMTFGTAHPVVDPIRSPFEVPPHELADYSWLGVPRLIPVCPYPVEAIPFGYAIPVYRPNFDRPR